MAHWTAKVKLNIEDDNGKLRAITETYLVNAETIEESQKRVHERFHGSTFDYEIRSVSKSGITEYIGVPEMNIE
jgi:hypothetical protein